MDAKGQLFFNDKPLDAAKLAQQFEATARRSPDTEVQLRVDEAVPYGQVVALMGAALQMLALLMAVLNREVAISGAALSRVALLEVLASEPLVRELQGDVGGCW